MRKVSSSLNKKVIPASPRFKDEEACSLIIGNRYLSEEDYTPYLRWLRSIVRKKVEIKSL